MKKVLIISDLIEASPRIPGISKYLFEFGWQAIILTGRLAEGINSKVKVVKTPYSNIVLSFKKKFGLNEKKELQEQIGIPLFLRKKKKSIIDKLINLVKEIIAYPDELKNWKPIAVKFANEVLEKEKIDAIISSSSPVTVHMIAKELKKKYKIPWIADLRDLWTQNHYYQYSRVRKFFEQKLELETLKDADALVTVSPIWTSRLKELHKRDTVYSVTNGFDPEKMNTSSVNLTEKFTITYTGRVYAEKQSPSKLFLALKDLITTGKINRNEIEVRFYGPKKEWLEKEIEDYELSPIVKQCGLIPRSVSFQKQRESQILLLLNWEDYREKGCYPLKTFEYLAARRPILSIGGSGDDVVKKLLSETKSGVYGKEIKNIKSYLAKFYSEYKQKGKVSYEGDVEKINKYSYREKAKEFTNILNQIT
ncbi:MAG: glycosyltransferase [Patescibacteria group bacterium]|nr:glycosyltransferase [Patescibacteria group bacterium]